MKCFRFSLNVMNSSPAFSVWGVDGDGGAALACRPAANIKYCPLNYGFVSFGGTETPTGSSHEVEIVDYHR